MAGDKLFRKPSLDVVQGDTRGAMFGKIVTVANMYPGKRVMTDTYDGGIKIGGTDGSSNVGILGYEASPLAYKPATRDTIYAVNDIAAVHNTPGMMFRGFLVPGSGTVVPGSRLIGHDSSGNFEISTVLGSTGSTPILAIAMEMVTNTVSVTDPVACWMQWLG